MTFGEHILNISKLSAGTFEECILDIGFEKVLVCGMAVNVVHKRIALNTPSRLFSLNVNKPTVSVRFTNRLYSANITQDNRITLRINTRRITT